MHTENSDKSRNQEGTKSRNSALHLHEQYMEANMLRGGLLWLIGIPLPIILILFLMGYL